MANNTYRSPVEQALTELLAKDNPSSPDESATASTVDVRFAGADLVVEVADDAQ